MERQLKNMYDCDLKVLHLNTFTYQHNLSYPHYQFHKDLSSIGIPSVIVSAEGDVDEQGVIILNKYRFFPASISKMLRKILFAYFFGIKKIYFYPEWNLDLISSKQIIRRLDFEPKVIMVYWSKLAFNAKVIYDLSVYYGAKVILCPADMAHLTGGCHYADGCQQYKTQCNSCPLLPSGISDLVRLTWNIKNGIFQSLRPSLIVGSDAIRKQANVSALTRSLMKYELLLSVDESIYKPGDKISARTSLGIDWSKKIILVGAANLENPRKGMGYFLSALDVLANLKMSSIKNEDVLVLVIGGEFELPDVPFKYFHLGYLKTQSDLALAYRASDVFACPSVNDSGPLMINQSIMSGCPVVSFDMGVAPDLVFNYETGYKAQLKDEKDFALGLRSMLDISDESYKKISENCRNLGLRKFSASENPKKLRQILQDVLSRGDF